MLCRNCNKVRSNRPRGLCYSCYYKPEVRALFPSTSKFARKGSGIDVYLPPLSDEPTAASPGSEDKILVLMERARNGQCLWHPMDAVKAMPTLESPLVYQLAGVA
jgi:hypothetical protein